MNNDEELIKINGKNINVLQNVLKNNNGLFYFDNDEIEIEPIKSKQIILLEDKLIIEHSKAKVESKQIKEQKLKVKNKKMNMMI